MNTAIALLIAIAIPLLALFLIYKLDFFKTGSLIFIGIAFAAGGLAYVFAAQVNWPAAQALHPLLDPKQYSTTVDFLIQFIAPVIEEILKGLVLLFLIRQKNFTYFIDGAIYGFAAGVGFAIVENFEYILAGSGGGLTTAISRVISTNLMHAGATATLGIILGIARFQKPARQTIYSFGGILLAIALHMGYNNLVTRVSSGWLMVYAIIIGCGAAGFIALMIRKGLAVEKDWIGQTLGVTDRVEKGEVSAIQNIENVDKILERLDERLGAEKGEKIIKLLQVQAKLGIQRKAAQLMENETMRRGIQSEVDNLRKEMEKLRREIGSYAMVYVRATHLEEIFSWQTALTAQLEVLAKGPKPTGPSWSDRLSSKIASSKDTKDP